VGWNARLKGPRHSGGNARLDPLRYAGVCVALVAAAAVALAGQR
jgi:hypothetical protein